MLALNGITYAFAQIEVEKKATSRTIWPLIESPRLMR